MQPTFESFICWYRRWKSGEYSKEYARQQVGFKKTRWYYLCRDYENGVDVSNYFN